MTTALEVDWREASSLPLSVIVTNCLWSDARLCGTFSAVAGDMFKRLGTPFWPFVRARLRTGNDEVTAKRLSTGGARGTAPTTSNGCSEGGRDVLEAGDLFRKGAGGVWRGDGYG